MCQVLAHNQCPEFLIENGKKIYLDNKVVYMDSTHWTKGLGSYPIEKKQYSQELFTQKTLEFIEQNQNNPFFVYLSVVIPHDNGETPEGKRYSDIPSFEPYTSEPWTESEKGYAAMITYLDTEVGKIMDKLKQLGLDENTLIVFTSDNGGDSPDRFKKESNLPFQGLKRDLYEGGIRVPFIARWKGTIQEGRTSSHVSAFWDFLPTACEIAGVDPSEKTDGISYLPELKSKNQARHESLYFEFHESGGRQAIIEGDWKLIRLNVNRPDKTTTELYNLKNDSLEQFDLAKNRQEKVTKLLQKIDLSHMKNEKFLFSNEK